MDVVDKRTRSRMMSNIRGKDTKPEKLLRSRLHKRGYRFRKNDKRLPGKPDIVFPKYRTVVEVRGCFWHRHKGCKYASTPKTRPEFWKEKFAKNVERDERNIKQLKKAGWRTIVVWECDMRRDPEEVARRVDRLLST